MGLEQVIADILRKGEEQREATLRAAEADREGLLREAREAAAALKQKRSQEAAAEIARLSHQEVLGAELEAKKQLLAAQKRLLDEVQRSILEELRALPPAKRSAIYERLFRKAKQELGGGRVLCTAADAKLLRGLQGFTPDPVLDGAGGLIFERRDGTIRLDFRFETVLNQLWDGRVREVFARLFG